MSKQQFTPDQIRNWKAYERVRIGGRFNMFDPRAQRLTSMSSDEWCFCMDNYSALNNVVMEEAMQLMYHAEKQT